MCIHDIQGIHEYIILICDINSHYLIHVIKL